MSLAPADQIAIATPSYAGDFERCELLCASIDRFVTGRTLHYLLVEDRDVPLFRRLEGPKRRIIAESELLPAWLGSWPDPLSLGRRRVWTGPGALLRGVPPLRGWHAQQLRKLALPALVPEQVLVFADSDVIFVRPFDLGAVTTPGGTALYRAPNAVDETMTEHVAWLGTTAAMLGIAAPPLPAHDYVVHLAVWRADVVRALQAHLEAVAGRDWVTAVARHRRFSEYTIYGRFVEAVLTPQHAGHALIAHGLVRSFWLARDLDGGLDSLSEGLDPGQVAIGVQSFLGLPVARLRHLFDAL